MSGGAKTIVEYFAEHERYKCGYCGTQDSNYSHGMWAHALAVQDYQDLLDRGWRRSGKYVYKPTLNKTCCPQYTIRCEVLNFTMRKSHKKAIKKVNKYLIHGIKPSSDKDEEADCDMTNDDQSKTGADVSKDEVSKKSEDSTEQSTQGDSAGAIAKEDKSKKAPQPGSGADPNKPKCKKAKELRKEKKLAKLAAKQGSSGQTQKASESSKPSQPEGKSLEELLDEPNKADKCAHKLEEEKGDLPAGYGSFHQQYLLDGKIICVGVIDILPNLVSSKYLYYDPDYHFLSLGTYSALREVAFVRGLNKHSSEMTHYYMGFYIHSCPKMKYKGQYHPSFLLCPETYTWNAVEKCAPMLDQKTYCRFADDSQQDVNGVIDLEAILVLYMRKMMTYTIYKTLSKDSNRDEDEVREYAGFVGKKCYTRMLLFRN